MTSCPYTETNTTLYSTLTPAAGRTPLTNRVTLALRPFSLLPHNTYRFKLSVTDSRNHTGFTEIDIHTAPVPSSGRLEVTPEEEGRALSTSFTLRASGWTGDVRYGPLFYRFGFRYFLDASSGESVEEWLTGVSADNQFITLLPHVDTTLSPQLLLQVFDCNGARTTLALNFSSVLTAEVESTVSSFSLRNDELFALLDSVQAMLTTQCQWTQALADLTTLLTSVHLDHQEIICEDSSTNALSPTFNLLSTEVILFKIRSLRLIVDLFDYITPATQLHHYQMILSLLEKATQVECDLQYLMSGQEESSQLFDQMDMSNLTSLLGMIISSTADFSEDSFLSRRGLSEKEVERILSIYRQIIYAQHMSSSSFFSSGRLLLFPRVRSTSISESLVQHLPVLGHNLCLRQGIHERPATVDLSEFGNLKSSHINLPRGYVAGGCSEDSCPHDEVRVDFGSDFFSQFFQWNCTSSEICFGVCVSSVQLYVDILWQGNPYSSLLKSPLVHLSVLNPSNGAPLSSQVSPAQLTFMFPITTPYGNSSDLACAVWDDVSRSWLSETCHTEVLLLEGTAPCVQCQCSEVGALFYTVLERCPQGKYGEICNFSK